MTNRLGSGDVNVLVLVKTATPREQYVWLFTDENRAEVLRSLGRTASDPSLSFTWYDAALMSQDIRRRSTSYYSCYYSHCF